MTGLRIGVDGYNIAMPDGTGVATYGFTLVETLKSMGASVEGIFGIPVGEKPALREILFYEALERPAIKRRGNPVINRCVTWSRAWRREQALEVARTGLIESRFFERRLPAFDRIVSGPHLFERAERHFKYTGRFLTLEMPNPPEIMHWTYPLPIRLHGAKNIYTLHDLVPLKLPYATLDRKALYYRTIEHCLRDADHICTVSESSRSDILAMFAADPARITNTYQTIQQFSAPPSPDTASLVSMFGLNPDGYFLYFGAIEPKKNVGRLLEAYLSTDLKTPLVVVGARAWQAERDLKILAADSSLSARFGQRVAERIVRLEYLPRKLLMDLVAHAKAVIFPSLYEGFGLPVLEAMQCGTPVITSNTSSLPEVSGDAALLVDPYDTGAIAAAIVRLDHDEPLRLLLSSRGRDRAAQFAPGNYRARLAEMYQLTLQGPSHG